MGRRARTNCSPVDSALEKYHHDIGNRLSGVFMPPHPACPANNEDSACDAFSMLTLDLRGKHGIKHTTTTTTNTTTTNNNSNAYINNNNNEDSFDEASINDSQSQKDDSAFDQITSKSHDNRSDTLSSLNSQHSDFSSLKEKRNIMDKLARAIFQRKHTCARCQRRSRSCLQNKTFNVSEKHYTCIRCRESNKAMKNLLVSGQDPNATTTTTTNNNNDNNISKNSADIILPKPRVGLKDSGYETVTSCSTVASAHSNSNSPYASSNKQNVETSNPSTATGPSPCVHRIPAVSPDEVDHEVDELIRKVYNNPTPCPNCRVMTNALHSSDINSTQNSYANNTKNVNNSAGLEQFLGLVGDDGCRALKQVKTRFVQNYDGYLPDHQHHPDANNHPQCNCVNNSDVTSTGTDINVPKSHTPVSKMCHICATTSRPCFRLPWQDGWLCEDCIDGML